MLTDERSYCFHGLHSNYRTGDTQDVLDMLRAYLIDIFPGGELRRSLRIARVASTLVIRTEMPQDIFGDMVITQSGGGQPCAGEEKVIAGPYSAAW